MTRLEAEPSEASRSDMELRIHGRGGQGGVSCAKILAAAHARAGRFVQAFGDYGGERAGAPVRAFVRVGHAPIQSRNKVTHPDHLLVLDESLLGETITSGLSPGGLLLVNSRRAPEELAAAFPRFRAATVDAESIARSHGIGTRSVVIVSTTMVGAAARLLDLPIDVVTDTFAELGLDRDAAAAVEAFAAVRACPAVAGERSSTDDPSAGGGPEWARALAGPILDVTELRTGRAPMLATGAWSTLRPRHRNLVAPCVAACPAGNDVVEIVQRLAEGDTDGAARSLVATNPLPGVCGRVCPGFCMQRCTRRELDEPVDVRGLERWLADHVLVDHPGGRARGLVEPSTVDRPRSVAVVGAGPAGLAASYALCLAGHDVTLVDAADRAGGLLSTGIPRYRLPSDVVEREIRRIADLGVRMRVGSRIDGPAMDRLQVEHDGLVVAVGLGRAVAAALPGAELAGIEQALDLLERVNGFASRGVELGAPERLVIGVRGSVTIGATERAASLRLGGRVVVVGGGNTAVDAARTAIRLGATEVRIVYRRAREQMPALPDEIDHALEEGIELQERAVPVAFLGESRVRAVVIAETELGDPDPSGRRRPVTTDRTRELACDHVLLALGQQVDSSAWPAGWSLSGDRFERDGEPLAAFAAGDHATGAGTVCHAIGSGRRAAESLLGLWSDGAPTSPTADVASALAVSPEWVRLERFERRPAAVARVLDAAVRRNGFGEVRGGLGDAREAERCLSCGRCTGCDRCVWFCPDGLVRRRARDEGAARYEVNQDQCKGCGICAAECPRGAVTMEQAR